jgi:hypothetical protein
VSNTEFPFCTSLILQGNSAGWQVQHVTGKLDVIAADQASATVQESSLASASSNGNASLTVSAYYNLVETDPAGYTSVVAQSAGGAVRGAGWIQYGSPLAGKALGGNNFWDKTSSGQITVEFFDGEIHTFADPPDVAALVQRDAPPVALAPHQVPANSRY